MGKRDEQGNQFGFERIHGWWFTTARNKVPMKHTNLMALAFMSPPAG
jgi:hypothetical protein